MTLNEMIRRMILCAPDGAGAGAGGTTGDDTPAGGDTGAAADGAAGADTPAGGDAGASGDGAAAGGGDWWAGLGEDAQGFVKAKGLDGRAPEDALGAAIEIARNAEKKLGHPADSLLSRPREGQDVAEWLAEQRDALGLPADAAGYEVKPPKDFPKEAWDGELAGRAAELAHQHAVPRSAHEAYVGLFAEYVQRLDAQAGAQLEEANTRLRGALEREWGDAAEANMAAARQAAHRVAEAAGLDGDAIEAMSSTLAAQVGDANVLRMFHAVAQALGEDRAAGIGRGAGGLSTEASDAQAELARLQAPGGEYYDAVHRGDNMAVKALEPRLKALRQAAAGG